MHESTIARTSWKCDRCYSIGSFPSETVRSFDDLARLVSEKHSAVSPSCRNQSFQMQIPSIFSGAVEHQDDGLRFNHGKLDAMFGTNADCNCCDAPDMPPFMIVAVGVGLGLLLCDAVRNMVRSWR